MISELFRQLLEIDQTIFLYLNGLHSNFGDYFMSTFSGKVIWVPMYASILLVLIKNAHWRVVLYCLMAIALTITFADQVCATYIRPVVARLRPCSLDNPISEWVHLVNGKRSGSFSFPSCHASNSFGLAFMLIYLFRNRWLTTFILIWAAVNSYSRIYLGVHYPTDLLAGALVGIIGASLMYYLLRKLTNVKRVEDKQASLIIYTGLLTVLGIGLYAIIQS